MCYGFAFFVSKMSDPVLDPERLLRIRNQPDPSRQHRGKCFQARKIYYSVYRVECIFSSQIVKDCNCMTQTLQLNIVWQRQIADVLTGFLFQKLPSIEIAFLQGLWKYNNPRKNLTAMKKKSEVEIYQNLSWWTKRFLIGIRNRTRQGQKVPSILMRIHNNG
jgi:hypothetical protein